MPLPITVAPLSYHFPIDAALKALKTDLGRSFSPETFDFGYSAMYLCNQRLYSARHARGVTPGPPPVKLRSAWRASHATSFDTLAALRTSR